jgi:adenylate cyclase
VPHAPISLERTLNLPVPTRELWDLLANTDHLDRSVGMPHVVFGGLTVTADGIFREARACAWGIYRARWREYPFEWVRGQRYAVLRVFEAGLLDTFYGGVEIAPGEPGSRLRVFVELSPRTWLGRLPAWLVGRKGVRDVLDYCRRYVAMRAGGDDIRLPPPTRITPPDPEALARLLDRLAAAGLAPAVVSRFGRHVGAASDAEVLRMQPYGLAESWGADRSEVLRLLSTAEGQGAVCHRWEVMCPGCRVPLASTGSLAALPGRVHCEACGIDYESDLARSVELRYAVQAALRPAKDEVYCIGGPANTPHIWLQQYLLPGTERLLALPLPAEPFRVRALRSQAICPAEPEEMAGDEMAFTWQASGWLQIRQRFRPGVVRLRLRNETDRVMVAILEQQRWDPLAITAAQVLEGAEFRELRGIDTPAPGASHA